MSPTKQSGDKQEPQGEPAEGPQGGRREANKRDKLLRIRRAARMVFLEKGYEEATLRQIADEANVAFGTLFLYAKNKQDLLLLLFDEELPGATSRAFEQANLVEGPLLDKLIAFFAELHTFFAQTPALSRDMMREFAYEDGIVAPRLWEEVLVIEDRLARLVASAQEDGSVTAHVAPGLAAHVLFSLHRVELRFCLSNPEPDIAVSLANLRRQFELVFAGLTPRRSASGAAP